MSEVDDQKLDQWLDSALSDYSQAEPPLGMEQRILSTLRQREAGGAVWLANWRWLTACATALVVALIGFRVWEAPARAPAPDATHTKVAGGMPARGTQATTSQLAAAKPSMVSGRKPALKAPRVVAEARLPRLRTFPGPESVTEQDRLLAAFVRSAPSEAAKVAREQQRFQQDGFQALAIPPISIPAIKMEE